MIDSVIDVLRMSGWVDDLPTLTLFQKEALAKEQHNRNMEEKASEANHIKNNFDLGKYS